MKSKLTERAVKNIILQQKPYEIVDSEINGFILRVQPSGVLTYYLVYRTLDGTKKRYKLGRYGAITVAQARDLAKQFSAKSLSGQDLQKEKKIARLEKEKISSRTLEGFIKLHYAPWVIEERKTGLGTIDRLNFNFSHLMKLPIESISPMLIEKWRAEQLKTGKHPATINRDITTLKSTLSKAAAWNWLEASPLAKLKPLKIDNSPKVRYLSKDEENRLMIELSKRDQQTMAKVNQNRFLDYLTPMVLLSINTGLRRGELFSLRWDHVDLNKAIITIAGDKSKNGKTRHIPLNSNALYALKNWHQQCSLQDQGLVFPNKEGKQIYNIRKSWNRLLKDSNISNFRWHDLRHHFASKLVMASVDLNTVRELLGHSNLVITLRYAHLAPEHKAEAVARLVD